MSRQQIMTLIGVLGVTFSSPAFGAGYYKQVMDKKANQYLQEGVFLGGKPGTQYSLLNIRRYFSKKAKTERIVLDLGDAKGNPLKNRVSFFHIAVDKDLSRVVIDLPQVVRSAIDAEKIKKIFSRSPFVKSAEITFDPADHATNITLDVKRGLAVEAFKMPSSKKPSRIVLDIAPASVAKKKLLNKKSRRAKAKRSRPRS